ncbi:MAG: hypothetical protein ACSHX7_05880 [Luteolibacter sp.]
MQRFEIEDLVSQDSHGVIFRAFDTETEQSVALRRFFPFGKEGGGLDKDEAAAFETASKRLAELHDPSLRSVIFGSVDPIDGIPFLVTQWIDGDSLQNLLADNKLESALVIDVVRVALESSILISKSLGQEAVWVETEVSSIVVGSNDSGRGFTFWISPLKWLGARDQSQGVLGIVELVEELTGWKNKVVADSSGFGLGGWVKRLKANPDTPLSEALETLNATTAQATAPAQAESAPLQPNTTKPVAPVKPPTQIKPQKSRLPLLLVLLVALLSTAIFLVVKQQTRVRGQEAPDVVATEATSEKNEAQTPAAEQPPETPAAETTAEESEHEPETKSPVAAMEPESETEPATTTEEPEPPAAQPGKITVRPSMGKSVENVSSGTPIVLEGKLESVRFSNSKEQKTLYLNFIDFKKKGAINGLAHKRDFDSAYQLQAFKKFQGKEIILDGEYFLEPFTGRSYVKIRSLDDIKFK